MRSTYCAMVAVSWHSRGHRGRAGRRGGRTKPIHTQKTEDVVITLTSETGQLEVGQEQVRAGVHHPPTGQPLDVGKVTLDDEHEHARHGAP